MKLKDIFKRKKQDNETILLENKQKLEKLLEQKDKYNTQLNYL
jgi:hypothetical protein